LARLGFIPDISGSIAMNWQRSRSVLRRGPDFSNLLVNLFWKIHHRSSKLASEKIKQSNFRKTSGIFKISEKIETFAFVFAGFWHYVIWSLENHGFFKKHQVQGTPADFCRWLQSSSTYAIELCQFALIDPSLCDQDIHIHMNVVPNSQFLQRSIDHEATAETSNDRHNFYPGYGGILRTLNPALWKSSDLCQITSKLQRAVRSWTA